MAVSYIATMAAFGSICWNNVSVHDFKNIMKESKIVIVFFLGIANFILDLLASNNVETHFEGFLYLAAVTTLLLLDVIQTKTKPMMIFIAAYVCVSTLYLIYQTTLGISYVGIVFYDAGENRVFYLRGIKRAIFSDILTLSLTGLLTWFMDPDFGHYLFVRSHIFRESGQSTMTRRDVSYIETRVNERRGRGSLMRGVSQLESVVVKNEREMKTLKRLYSMDEVISRE